MFESGDTSSGNSFIQTKLIGGIAKKNRTEDKFTFCLIILEYLTSNRYALFFIFQTKFKTLKQSPEVQPKTIKPNVDIFTQFDSCSVTCEHSTAFQIRINNSLNIKAFPRRMSNKIELFSATTVYINFKLVENKAHSVFVFLLLLCSYEQVS